VAGEDGVVIMGTSHIVLDEGGNAVSITELASGEKRGVEAIKDESLGCFSREARHWKGSNGGGIDSSAVGHRDGDGVMLSGHIGKTCYGGRKEMACCAGVGNCRGGNYRWGRGTNWCGCNGFN